MTADPFCVRSMTDATRFYESEHFMAVYDIRPVVKGHSLLIPKRHVLDILELTGEEIEGMHDSFGTVLPKLLDAYCGEDRSYDLTSQIGRYSGRSVEHLHFHVLPRSKDDVYNRSGRSIFEDIKLNRANYSYGDVLKEVARLRKEFRYRPG